MSFSEERFNTGIRYGQVGGPEFSTSIAVVNSGFEQRNINWQEARGKWVPGEDMYTRAEIDYLIAFFRARKGRAIGFRFKDWSDYQITAEQGVLGTGVGDGTSSYPLYKKYSTGVVYTLRRIYKPVTGTIIVYVNGVADAGATVDYTTGIVTLSAPAVSTDVLTAAGEFDVPVRFDTDKFDAEFMVYRDDDGEALYQISGLPIIEIRIQV